MSCEQLQGNTVTRMFVKYSFNNIRILSLYLVYARQLLRAVGTTRPQLNVPFKGGPNLEVGHTCVERPTVILQSAETVEAGAPLSLQNPSNFFNF